MAERRRIKLKVNGREYEGLVEARRHLVDFLRKTWDWWAPMWAASTGSAAPARC